MKQEQLELSIRVNEAEARFIISLLSQVQAPVVSDRREAIVALIQRIDKHIVDAKSKTETA